MDAAVPAFAVSHETTQTYQLVLKEKCNNTGTAVLRSTLEIFPEHRDRVRVQISAWRPG